MSAWSKQQHRQATSGMWSVFIPLHQVESSFHRLIHRSQSLQFPSASGAKHLSQHTDTTSLQGGADLSPSCKPDGFTPDSTFLYF